MTARNAADRKPFWLSSRHFADPHFQRVMMSTKNGWQFFFHTDFEHRPEIIIDLEQKTPFNEVVVWNRTDGVNEIRERCLPLVIQASADLQEWNEIARVDYVFGGRSIDSPLHLTLERTIKARFIKFFADRTTCLHFDNVEIIFRSRDIVFGVIEPDPENRYKWLYYCQHDAGFFSMITVSISDCIAALKKHGIYCSVKFDNSMKQFREDCFIDPAERFFCASAIDALPPLIDFDWRGAHVAYGALDLAALKQWADFLFPYSSNVYRLYYSIVKKYNFDAQNTIALVYRGTDKGTEVTLASPDAYIERADFLMQQNASLRLLVQTDQQQVRDTILERFGNRVFFFEEMPVTKGTTVLHNIGLEKEFGITKPLFGDLLLAVTLVLSKCKYLITHTGNLSFWIAVQRGHVNGVTQFDASGSMVVY